MFSKMVKPTKVADKVGHLLLTYELHGQAIEFSLQARTATELQMAASVEAHLASTPTTVQSDPAL